jgi:hypothetical protein
MLEELNLTTLMVELSPPATYTLLFEVSMSKEPIDSDGKYEDRLNA